MSKVVLITGGSSGIGKAIGEFLFHKGYTVYGTSRNPEKITNSVFPLIALDVRSKESIQHAIDKLIAGRTAIVIAHRLSTIRKANKIMVLDKGEIKEIGSHAELMERKGFYYQLHKMQFEKQEKIDGDMVL